MEIKPLSLCLFSYNRRYYLTHPWKLITDLWIGAKNLWHRARYGYAYIDAWNMSSAWCEMGANMLAHLAEYGCAYPGNGEFDTPEKWHAHLEDMARRLRKCADIDWDNENEYYVDYFNDLGNDKLRQKYWQRSRELQAVRMAFIRETFEEFARNFDCYWD